VEIDLRKKTRQNSQPKKEGEGYMEDNTRKAQHPDPEKKQEHPIARRLFIFRATAILSGAAAVALGGARGAQAQTDRDPTDRRGRGKGVTDNDPNDRAGRGSDNDPNDRRGRGRGSGTTDNDPSDSRGRGRRGGGSDNDPNDP
jgi:hypothetical protein